MLWYIIIMLNNPEGIWSYDSSGYWQMAVNFVDNGVLSRSYDSELIPEIMRTPLYPLYIAVFYFFGDGSQVAVFFQLILGTANCVILYRLALLITDNKKLALITAILLAVDVNSIVMSNYLMTETLFTFLLLLSVLCFVQFVKSGVASKLFYSGLWLGLAALCRPSGLFIFAPAAVVLLLYFNGRGLKGVKLLVAYAFPFLILIAVWVGRNYSIHEKVIFSTTGQFNLCSSHAANLMATQKNIPFFEARTMLWKDIREDWAGGEPKDNQVEYSRFLAQKSIEIIKDNPYLLVKQQLLAVLELLVKPMRRDIDLQLGLKQGYNVLGYKSGVIGRMIQSTSPFTLVLVVIQLIFAVAAVVGTLLAFYYMFRARQYATLLYFLLLTGLMMNMTLPPDTYARFRVPLTPYLLLFGVWGIFLARHRFKPIRIRS